MFASIPGQKRKMQDTKSLQKGHQVLHGIGQGPPKALTSMTKALFFLIPSSQITI
jgi:hypothetical protein